jgi:outer membrane lipoprotein-sorting protein
MLRKSVALLFLLSLALAPGSLAAEELTADQLIAKVLEARGGVDTWKAIKTARMTGKMMMGPMEAPIVVEFKRPQNMRVEFTLQGMTGVQAYDGETAWMVMPFMGKTEPEKMPAEQVKMIKEQADFDGPLMDYAEKGHTVELLGVEDVEGTEAYKLKVTKKDGDVDVIYIDAEYYMPFKSESKRTIQGQEMEVSTVIGDYKEVGSVIMPHSLEVNTPGGMGGQVLTFDKIELDVDLPADRFAMPEPAPTEEAEEEAAEEE